MGSAGRLVWATTPSVSSPNCVRAAVLRPVHQKQSAVSLADVVVVTYRRKGRPGSRPWPPVSPPADALIGKWAFHAKGYVEGYENKVHQADTGHAMRGCTASCLVVGTDSILSGAFPNLRGR